MSVRLMVVYYGDVCFMRFFLVRMLREKMKSYVVKLYRLNFAVRGYGMIRLMMKSNYERKKKKIS